MWTLTDDEPNPNGQNNHKASRFPQDRHMCTWKHPPRHKHQEEATHRMKLPIRQTHSKPEMIPQPKRDTDT
jgi:hypothetical protein